MLVMLSETRCGGWSFGGLDFDEKFYKKFLRAKILVNYSKFKWNLRNLTKLFNDFKNF